MEGNWQAELNSHINSSDGWQKGVTPHNLSKIHVAIVLLFIFLVIPAIISGSYDQRSRASGVQDNVLKTNLNIPICSTSTIKSCGFTSVCGKVDEGKTCEYLSSCQRGVPTSSMFVCKGGRWVYTTQLHGGYCDFCNKNNVASVSLVSPSPTVFQGPTPDIYLHK